MNDQLNQKYLEIITESGESENTIENKKIESISVEILTEDEAIKNYIESKNIKALIEKHKGKTLDEALSLIGGYLSHIKDLK